MADENELIWITFQASKEQREKLEKLAKQEERTMSAWLRWRIEQAWLEQLRPTAEAQ